MKRAFLIVIAVFLLPFSTGAIAQTTQPANSVDLASGFKLRPTGGIDIGDIYAEVVYFDADWQETEEHDVFQPQIQSPDAKSHVATGAFAVPKGSFTLTEHITAIDGGIRFTADVAADKEIQCNELSLALNLPVSLVGGKKITVDGEAVNMPMEPAKQGEAHIFDKEGAKQIDIPTATGTLTLSGNFSILIQDDREWGDARYGLRLQFSPGSGPIKASKIEVKMTSKTAG
jgi:hypothetical protein